jgi:TatD DNase family protein
VLVDTHCHLADPAFADVAAVLARAAAAGVTRVLAVGGDPAENRAVLALAASHPAVRPALGCHPERLELTDEDLEEVTAQLDAHGAALAAVGEIGLPWYALGGRPDATAQAACGRARLARLLDAAARLGRPASLHAPHAAAAEALALLAARELPPCVFHWHKADPDVTRRIVERGHLLGVTPEVLYRARDQAWVREVPLGSLVAESDGPWRYAGLGDRPGEPAMVAEVAAGIARLRGLPVGEVAAALADNARRVLG